MRIIIVGPACSGKDYLCSFLMEKGLNKAITYTTRPIRDSEIDGKDYHFINIDTFNVMLNNNEFYEYDHFNDWYYGSSKNDFNTCDLFIKTPRGIAKLDEDDRLNSYVIYLNMSEMMFYQQNHWILLQYPHIFSILIYLLHQYRRYLMLY